MKSVTILITSAGGEAALNCLHALRRQKTIKLRIICVDKSPLSAGLYLADKHFLVPDVGHSEYLTKVLNICLEEKVDVVIPIYSKEIPVFSKNLKIFQANDLDILISSPSTIAKFINKWKTYLFFLENKIPTPKTWLFDKLSGVKKNLFPLHIKPCVGSGSRANYYLADRNDFIYYKNKIKNEYVAQEYIDSPEYTIDILADKSSKVVAAVPRERLKTKSGMAVATRTVRDNIAIEIAEHIVREGKLIGPINIQYFRTGNERFFFDVNPRLAAGGLPLAVKAGANIPLAVVQLSLGLPVQIVRKYKSLTMLRYYTELFVENAD